MNKKKVTMNVFGLKVGNPCASGDRRSWSRSSAAPIKPISFAFATVYAKRRLDYEETG